MHRCPRSIGLALVVCFAGSAVAADKPDEAKRGDGAKKTKIVLIGHAPDHPHGTHAYLPDSRLLAKCLEQTPGVRAVVSDGWPKDPTVLEDARAIVFHCRMGGDLLFHKDHLDQAKKLMKKGVGLTAIHWATGAGKGEVGELWQRTLGAWFNTGFSKVAVETAKLRRGDKKHPVCAGWEDYDLRDEYYFKLKFMPKAKPVMKAKLQGNDYPVGWVYERPETKGGRSFGFVCGHFHELFGIEAFRRSIVNGILWTAHVEVPETGAPCKITKEDMKLPPPPKKK